MADESAVPTTSSGRAQRFLSHAIVELRRWSWCPFGVRSGILMDLSLAGFKLELTSESQYKPGEIFWLRVPLSPLGIHAPSHLVCQSEVRWFDAEKFRIGGVFMQLSDVQRHVIEEMIAHLEKRGGI